LAPSLGNSKLLCLNKNDESVYLACLTCSYSLTGITWREEIDLNLHHRLYFKPLEVLQLYPTTLADLDDLWMFYHSNRQNRHLRTSQMEKHGNQYYDAQCLIYLIPAKPEGCFNFVVLHFFNLSRYIGSGKILIPLMSYPQNRSFSSGRFTVSGARFNGLQYTVFVKHITIRNKDVLRLHIAIKIGVLYSPAFLFWQ